MAPLKPAEGVEVGTDLVAFPRLQKRGPIEAYARVFGSGRWPFGFHAYKSVAPLKQHQAWATQRPAREFPRLQKRGPIEAPQRQLLFIAILLVSTLTKAWPH